MYPTGFSPNPMTLLAVATVAFYFFTEGLCTNNANSKY